MGQLPAEMLATVPHVTFGVFNLAIPSIIGWALVIVIFCAAAWLRLPKIF